jgi:hypothetical protein
MGESGGWIVLTILLLNLIREREREREKYGFEITIIIYFVGNDVKQINLFYFIIKALLLLASYMTYVMTNKIDHYNATRSLLNILISH